MSAMPTIPSMADQIRAAARAMFAFRCPPPSQQKGEKNSASAARAERTRHLFLRLLAEHPSVSVAMAIDRHPIVNTQAWSWAIRTLIEQGLAERVPGAVRPLHIRITDAGRATAAHLSQEQQ